MNRRTHFFSVYFWTFFISAISFSLLHATPQGSAQQSPPYRDLEAKIDSFVLETKQIVIPDYPDAFNPSIIRWNGQLLLCFRYRDASGSTDPMAFVWLDDDFNVVSKPHHLIRLFEPYSKPSRGQDPRLVILGDDLYIVYNNFVTIHGGENRRTIVAKIYNVASAFFSFEYEVLTKYPGEIDNKQEKNWTPFVYEDTLLLAYSLNPHLILLPSLDGSKKCEMLASTKRNIAWNWGVLRGGTNALNIGGKYLGFFHSVKTEQTLQSAGASIPHYFMGAYLFDESPPFKVMEISSKPIIGPNFYNGITHNTWKPLRVVFPGGFVFDDKYIWVVYGRQDYESWVVKMDREGLLNSLIKL